MHNTWNENIKKNTYRIFLLFFFLYALASLGSMLESGSVQWVIFLSTITRYCFHIGSKVAQDMVIIVNIVNIVNVVIFFNTVNAVNIFDIFNIVDLPNIVST